MLNRANIREVSSSSKSDTHLWRMHLFLLTGWVCTLLGGLQFPIPLLYGSAFQQLSDPAGSSASSSEARLWAPPPCWGLGVSRTLVTPKDEVEPVGKHQLRYNIACMFSLTALQHTVQALPQQNCKSTGVQHI